MQLNPRACLGFAVAVDPDVKLVLSLFSQTIKSIGGIKPVCHDNLTVRDQNTCCDRLPVFEHQVVGVFQDIIRDRTRPRKQQVCT